MTQPPPEKSKRLTLKSGYKQRLLKSALRIASIVFPQISANIIFYLWFKTFRHATPARELAWIANATPARLTLENGHLNAWIWGHAQQPRVLLVHGWNGRGSQMGAFAEPLLAAGFGVVAVDLPGHGDSSGNHCNLLIGAQALHAAQQAWGPFVAVIGHSFGAAASALALSEQLAATKIIAISMPQNVRWLLANYCHTLGVSARVEQKVERNIEKSLGQDIWQRLALERVVSKVSAPGLLVHDREDDAIPFSQAQAIARVWPQATLVATDGLGHYRIIRSSKVIEIILAFVRGDATPNPTADA
ncbi:MAG: alpha/beta fold hydrolase [Gammaproteobacteria bacterium]|nr:alpha/beta fold hydrolase [Gammaproteobacteria bacterium]